MKKEEIIKKIKEETGFSIEEAIQEYEELFNSTGEKHERFKAWCNNEKYKGVTLSTFNLVMPTIAERIKMQLKYPKNISNEYLKEFESSDNVIERIWQLVGADLRYTDMKEISKRVLQRCTFSTTTQFPNKELQDYANNLIRQGFEKGDGIDELHIAGLDGKGVHCAIIDQAFIPEHQECKDKLGKSIFIETNEPIEENLFHGISTMALFVGENIGVAPNSVLHYYYSNNQENIDNLINHFNMIKEYNEKSKDEEKIQIISCSTSLSYICSISTDEQVQKFNSIKEELENQNIAIFDADFLRKFFLRGNRVYDEIGECVESISLDSRLCIDNNEREKIILPYGGIVTPLIATENEYVYNGNISESWSIPRIAGVFAIARQIQKDIRVNEFVDILRNTSLENKDNFKIISTKNAIYELLNREIQKGNENKDLNNIKESIDKSVLKDKGKEYDRLREIQELYNDKLKEFQINQSKESNEK